MPRVDSRIRDLHDQVVRDSERIDRLRRQLAALTHELHRMESDDSGRATATSSMERELEAIRGGLRAARADLSALDETLAGRRSPR